MMSSNTMFISKLEVLMKKSGYLPYLAAGGLLFWAVLFFLQAASWVSPDKISNFAAQCEFVVHFFTLMILVLIYQDTDKAARAMWRWLLAINISLFLIDFAFYVTVYIPKSYVLSASFITVVFGYIPYLIFLLSSIILLSNILLQGVLSCRFFAKLLPFFVLLNLVIIFLFLASIHYDFRYFSWQIISHVSSLTAEFVIFDLALLCLIYSENRGFTVFLMGLVILIAGDFFINDSFLSQTSQLLPIGELLWFLGLMGMFWGILLIYKSKTMDTKIWCSKTNRIKNKLALWTFGASIVGFLIFFSIAYCFSMVNRQICLGLPLFIMGYSMIIVLISVFIGRRFEEPFKKITANVEALMLDQHSKIDPRFTTEEFVYLQDFINKAFAYKEEKDQAKRKLGEVSAQVAHDIRSPLAALNTCLGMLPQIPEEQRILMRNAANRINDIANNLLRQYKGLPVETKPIQQVWLLAPVVESMISEKRLGLKNQLVSIDADITAEGYAAFAEFDTNEMKRLLSNLINNALEAFSKGSKGRVTVFLDAKRHYIDLAIIDNGIGISSEHLAKVLEPGFSSKEQGNGLGLSSAKKLVEGWGGGLRLESTVANGTKVSLHLPRANTPIWFVSKVVVDEAVPIGILDDDQSVHAAWDQRLLAVSKKLCVEHFRDASHFITWYQAQTGAVQVFSDYELLGDTLTGLDVLEKLKLGKNAILVTSHYEDKEIIDRCQSKGIRLLPKNLLAHIPIEKISNDVKKTKAKQRAYDLVFFDDNPEVCNAWELNASVHGKKILIFSNLTDFEAALPGIDPKTPIYIDSELGDDLKGEEYSKILFEQGYTELYLATGHDPEYFGPLPWIKEIVTKLPPF